jgi:hypothetical protein
MSIPKPILTFAVGVTGHRSARLAHQDLSRIEHQLAEVFRNIETACLAELDRHKGLYAEPFPRINLITSLADGTDALAIKLCAKFRQNQPHPHTENEMPSEDGWTSIGIIPCPEEQNIELLRSTTPPENIENALAQHKAARAAANEVITLPTTRSKDKNGFVRAGNLMLRQIDLLVAVWDGQVEGSAGGTADLVAIALEDGIPVVWIAASKDQHPWMISHIEDVRRDTPYADATSGPIAEAMQRELGLRERSIARRDLWRLETPGTSAEMRRQGFMNETMPRWRWCVYDILKVGFFRPWKWRAHRCSSVEQVRDSWAPYLSTVPDGGRFRERIDQVLLPRFAVADALATYYGDKYRSAYVLAYLLSTFAILTALLDLAIPDLNHILPRYLPSELVRQLQIGLAVIELTIIVTIAVVVFWGQHRRWHDRWLDYRALAETLRHLRFLGLLGQYEKHSYAEAAARPGSGWLLWYLRATMRELGVPSGDLGPEYQRQVLTVVATLELDPQIDYHAANMESLNRLHHRLHREGDLCFLLALGILAVFLLVSSFWDVGDFAFFFTLATAFLPALGAAFAGIRFTGDFDGFAQRSAETGAELDILRRGYDLVLNHLDFDETAEFVFSIARTMAVDINGWTTLYTRKPLTLPG